MKKLFLLIIGLLIGLMSYSQQLLQISYADGTDITDSIVYVYGDANTYEIEFPGLNNHINVWNTSISSTDVIVVKQIIEELQGTENYFCWDLCYGYNVDTSGIITLPSVGFSSNFSAYYKPNNQSGITKIKYLFLGSYGQSSAYIEVWYDTYVGIEEVTNNEKIFPNPTKDIVNLGKEYKNIKVYSIYGNLLNSYNNINKVNFVEYVCGVYILQIDNKYQIKIIKQ